MSPFQSRTYSASPSPSPSPLTKTTPPLVYPDNLMRAAPPTLTPPTCQSSSTSHWGACLPNQYETPLQPLTWAHLRSTPLSMPSSTLRTAVISNISARHGPKPRNTKRRSTNWKKASSTPSPISSITRKPSSKLWTGMSLTIGFPPSPSPSEKGPMSPQNGSNSLTMGVSPGTANTMAQATSP